MLLSIAMRRGRRGRGGRGFETYLPQVGTSLFLYYI